MALDERASVCTFDCPDTCSLTVTVEDERIVKVRGSNAVPYTAGVICSKVAQGMEAFVHGPRPKRSIGCACKRRIARRFITSLFLTTDIASSASCRCGS